MSKRSFVAGFVLTLVLLSTTLSVSSAASMPIIKGSNAHPQGMTTAERPSAGTEAFREYWCRRVTARELRIFATSTGSTVVGQFYYGDVFATTGIANNRYHVYNPYNDTWNGWVTADPQWTDYVSHYCVG